MKSRIYFLAIAFFTIAAIGQLNISSPFFVASLLKPAGAIAPTYLLYETFETNPGADNTWSIDIAGGTWNYDASTAGLGSMAGAECMSVVNPNGGTRSSAFTATAHVYGKFRFRHESNEAITIAAAAASGPAPLKLVIVGTASTLYNGTGSTAGPTISTGTDYYVWIEVNGTSSKLWISTSNSKPGTVSAEVTGDNSSDSVKFQVSEGGNGTMYFDHIEIDDVEVL